MSSSVALTLNPVPGFCVKSIALQPAVVHRTATSHPLSTPSDTTGASSNTIPKGLKVFVNIAWDTNVPPPPPASEDAIQKAMLGRDYDESNSDGWFIPVIVSDLRDDKDKAGKAALVIDCVFNPSIKSRTLKEADFKAFIIELALQRIESQTSLSLSRQIGMPNIASKGKPVSRQMLVPGLLIPPHNKSDARTTLIQELASPTTSASAPGPKEILKSASNTHTPTWTWTPTNDQRKIRFMINVPNLTHAHISNSTLDVEPRRVVLHVPSLYDLDINLDAALDTEPTASHGRLGEGATELKRLRDLDVDGAKAEWRVSEKVIVLLA
ncbi:hypothetical protein CY34DRAFT_108871 [Suillus luteus UH-Slu-Lm8-n1]|uniref:PIH1 N-terminal domain-containing protein n=1 Tax=Suillus luteus UH-Slu-Lm8-n1 TaxID=930992 RepID=A0A0D0AUH4_9AGAM|nr:hypothetical protein CY34DRAFT_108871 [Suillus luteus UH-Slu-Lm8-n1]